MFQNLTLNLTAQIIFFPDMPFFYTFSKFSKKLRSKKTAQSLKYSTTYWAALKGLSGWLSALQVWLPNAFYFLRFDVFIFTEIIQKLNFKVFFPNFENVDPLVG